MECKNPHCKFKGFIAVVEEENKLIGIKCTSCGARYSMAEIEVKESVNREGFWNSVKWKLSL